MRACRVVLLLLPLGSCTAPVEAERLTWSVDCPAAVEKGAAFEFTVRAREPQGVEVKGLEYQYRIRWAPGSGNPLQQTGTTGTVMKAHARTVAGPAEFSILCEDAAGAQIVVPLHPAPTLVVK